MWFSNWNSWEPNMEIFVSSDGFFPPINGMFMDLSFEFFWENTLETSLFLFVKVSLLRHEDLESSHPLEAMDHQAADCAIRHQLHLAGQDLVAFLERTGFLVVFSNDRIQPLSKFLYSRSFCCYFPHWIQIIELSKDGFWSFSRCFSVANPRIVLEWRRCYTIVFSTPHWLCNSLEWTSEMPRRNKQIIRIDWFENIIDFFFPLPHFFSFLFPTCQVRVVRFYVCCPSFFFLFFFLFLLLLLPAFFRLLRLVLADIFAVIFGRCDQMSTSTSREQWATPDLNSEL